MANGNSFKKATGSVKSAGIKAATENAMFLGKHSGRSVQLPASLGTGDIGLHGEINDAEQKLMDITEGHGYDDVFVYVPVRSVAEMGDRLLAFDGCMNFFAGPTDNQFKADINLYNAHYTSTHILGTTGGNNDDLLEALQLAAVVEHIRHVNNLFCVKLIQI